MSEYTKITASADFSSPVTAPPETMRSFVVTILIVSIAAVIVILGLVIMLFLLSGRGEMGIYLTLGVRKRKIMGRVIVKVLTAAVLAMALSLFTGNAISDGVGRQW